MITLSEYIDFLQGIEAKHGGHLLVVDSYDEMMPEPEVGYSLEDPDKVTVVILGEKG